MKKIFLIVLSIFIASTANAWPGSRWGEGYSIPADTDGTMAADSDARIPTQKAVKTLVANTSGCSVVTYGATGGADDTTAFQAALDACNDIYVPEGTYIVSNLTITNDGTKIHGAGPGSVLQFKTGSTGAMITTGANRIELRSIRLDGGLTSTQAAVSSSPANRSGIDIKTQLDSKISGVTINGFAKYGLFASDSAISPGAHLVISDSTFYNNWTGLYLGPSNAEYLKITSLDVTGCYYAVYISSGNITMTSCRIAWNGYGIYLLGTDIGNNGHGNISSSTINHNTTAIYAVGITNGFNFTANCVFDGNVYLVSSTGINITNGIIAVDNLYLDGGGYNLIAYNYWMTSYGGKIWHTYNGNADTTMVINNYAADGTTVEKSFISGAVGAITGTAIISQTTGTSSIGLGGVSNNQYRWRQKITLGAPLIISAASFYLGSSTGSPTGNITVKIETDADSDASGILADQSAIGIVAGTASAENVAPMKPFLLAAGSYWITIAADGQTSGNSWGIIYENSDVYAGGNLRRTSIGDSSGTPTVTDLSGYDLKFRVFTPSYSQIAVPGTTLLATPIPGLIEADADHIYWTNAAGSRLTLDNAP